VNARGLPGIGPWTSTIYLLMVLDRPDVWPAGDIALAESVGQVKRLGRRPDAVEMGTLGEAWRPWVRSRRGCSGTTTWTRRGRTG
jgi:DNA-3-methyladenine glycosylase II